MANDLNTSNAGFAEASMSVPELNNYIVSLRSLVKRAKHQIIQKLIRKVALYKKKRGTDDQIKANCQKVDRLLDEIQELKKVKVDHLSKYCLGNVMTVQQAALKSSLADRAYTRVACHKVIKTNIEKWRHSHTDWQSLAAFAVSKTTGRRFKKRKSTEKGDVKVPSQIENRCQQTSAEQTMSGDSSECEVSANSTNSITAGSNEGHKSITVVQKSTKDEKKTPRNSKLISENRSPDVTVKLITLGELSDEELFLPPVNDNGSLPDLNVNESVANVDGDFFLASSADDSDTDVRDDELDKPGTENGPMSDSELSESSSNDREVSGNFRSLKPDQKLQKKLSMKREKRIPAKISRFSAEKSVKKSYATNRSEFQLTRNNSGSNRHQVKLKSGQQWTNPKQNNVGKNDRQYRLKSNVPLSHGAKQTASKQTIPVENLHPSWEASRRKKEQQKNIFSFQGTKKVFVDDD